MNDKQRLELAKQVATAVFDNTESFEVPDSASGDQDCRRTLGVELAYLLYAIVAGRPYEASPDSELLRIVDYAMPHDEELQKIILR